MQGSRKLIGLHQDAFQQLEETPVGRKRTCQLIPKDFQMLQVGQLGQSGRKTSLQFVVSQTQTLQFGQVSDFGRDVPWQLKARQI
jgi:hypothetical protein